MIAPAMLQRGFLPEQDPLTEFPPGSEFASLDALGRDLPSMLHDKGFRALARSLKLPPLPAGECRLRELRLYYVRLGFLASAYVNQVGQEPATLLPRNIALPLCDVCARLERPPILSYDGYALFNWKRFDHQFIRQHRNCCSDDRQRLDGPPIYPGSPEIPGTDIDRRRTSASEYPPFGRDS